MKHLTNKQSNRPNHGSGKTQFTRGKARGESWITRRAVAVMAGTFQQILARRPS